MPKQKTKNKLSDKEQWKRFKEAAKKIDLSPDDAENAFKELNLETATPKNAQVKRSPSE